MARAISDGNSTALEKIPRIGKKVAQRLVLELREKMAKHLVGVDMAEFQGNL